MEVRTFFHGSLWEFVVLLMILGNSAALSAYDYTDRGNNTERNKTIDKVCYFFTAFFILEADIKIIATGIWEHQKSYFKSPWNIFDFAVMILWIIYIVPGIFVLRGLRILIVVRMLKVSYTLTNMKKLLEPLTFSLTQLPNVVIFLLFILFLFSLIGVQQFAGDFYYRCRKTPEPEHGKWEIDESFERLCSLHGYGDFNCPKGTYCGHPDEYDLHLSEDGEEDTVFLYYGVGSYDDVLASILASFQIITFDGWTDFMYKYQDSTNSVFARIFFPALVFIGGFFSLSFIVAVIVDSFMISKEEMQKAKHEAMHANKMQESGEKDSIVPFEPIKGLMPVKYSYKSWDMGASASKIVPGIEEETTQSPNYIQVLTLSLVDHSIFNAVVVLLIVGNLIILSIYHYDMPDENSDLLDVLNTIFFASFWVEMMIKMFARGFKQYFKDKYNILDFLLNILGIVEVALTFSSLSHEYKARTVIVIIRTIRVFKLVNKWKPLGELLTFISNSSADIINFAVLLIICIFMFAIIGMELFAGEVKFNEENKKDLIHGMSDKINFDTLGDSLRFVYLLMVGDYWALMLYQYSRFNKTAGILYFLSTFLIFNIFLLNMFLAILLQNFFEDEQKKKLEEEEKRNQAFLETKKKNKPIIKEGDNDYREIVDRYKHREQTLLNSLKVFMRIISLGKEMKAKHQQDVKAILFGVSLGMFHPENDFRRFIHFVTNSTIYQVTSYLMMFLNSVMLTFHTPLHDPHGGLIKAVMIIDILTFIFFALDILIKSVAYGFITNGPESYLRNSWNIVDFMSTLIQLVCICIPNENEDILRILYVIRVLRIVRIVTVNEGFRMCIQAIVNGFLKISQTLFIAALFFIIFAVIGVQLFGGLLYYCDRKKIVGEAEIENVFDCMNYGGEWRDRDASFNNVLIAIMTLFELFTGKGYVNLYRYLPDIAGEDEEPKRSSYPFSTIFVVVFSIIGFIFIRAIITGVISDTFFKEKDALQGFNDLSVQQVKWAKLARIMFKAHPIKKYPKEALMRPLHEILTHKNYKILNIIVLIFYGVGLSLTWHRSSASVNTAHGKQITYKSLGVCIYISLGFFGLEIVLKLLCYGLGYFHEGWNRFDFIVVTIAIIFIIIGTGTPLNEKPQSAVLYIFLVGKLLSMFKYAKVLYKMFQTFILALPAMINLALLLLVVIYLFAVAGVMLFAEIKMQTYLEEHANFQNFWTAFLTVFRMSTFEGWNDLMHDAMRSRSQYFNCAEYPTYQQIEEEGGEPIGCGLPYAPVFCIFLMLIVVFVFLNLFIAIVVGSIIDITKLSESVLSDEKLEKFQKTWQGYDPQATGFMKYCKLRDFLQNLGKPLGVSRDKMESRYYSAMTLWMLDLCIYHDQATNRNYIEFYDVLEALVKRSIYRAETLDNIYNNPSKNKLNEGLESLWDQKSQLIFENQPPLQKVEDLRRYYAKKNDKTTAQPYVKRKVRMPLLVLSILMISRTLKKSARARKKGTGTEKNGLLVKAKSNRNLLDAKPEEAKKASENNIDDTVGSNNINKEGSKESEKDPKNNTPTSKEKFEVEPITNDKKKKEEKEPHSGEENEVVVAKGTIDGKKIQII